MYGRTVGGLRVAARGSGAGSAVNHVLFVATATPLPHRGGQPWRHGRPPRRARTSRPSVPPSARPRTSRPSQLGSPRCAGRRCLPTPRRRRPNARHPSPRPGGHGEGDRLDVPVRRRRRPHGEAVARADRPAAPGAPPGRGPGRPKSNRSSRRRPPASSNRPGGTSRRHRAAPDPAGDAEVEPRKHRGSSRSMPDQPMQGNRVSSCFHETGEGGCCRVVRAEVGQQKHHFAPQFLLHHFAGPKGKLVAHQVMSERRFPTAVRALGHRNFGHSIYRPGQEPDHVSPT